MSSVRFVFPKLRLAAQLKEAGGLTVADAVEAAHDNLGVLKPQGLTALQAATQEAMECFGRFPQSFSAEALQELYGISARAVGIGAICDAPAADTAFISLCALLDHLSNAQLWDLQPIAVHVQTLQLLAVGVREQLDPISLNQILAGLQKVTGRYSAASKAALAASG
ncbi:MAG TPA: hypothetical protein VGG29_05580 [Caulobacteraceae bacterium]|jgi:hypothetical protein